MGITGGCYCGKIRYEVNGLQEGAFQCHCRECQYFTGGNSNIVIVYAESDFNYTKGVTTTFSRSDLKNPSDTTLLWELWNWYWHPKPITPQFYDRKGRYLGQPRRVSSSGCNIHV
jgi:hypothetical protein